MLSRDCGQSLNPTTARQGQVLEQIEMGKKLSDELHSAIERLQDRISAVLLPDSPCGSDGQKERACQVGLAEVLSEQNRKTQYAITRLNGLIERCEL